MLLSSIFDGIYEKSDKVTCSSFLICVITALVIGLCLALLFAYKSRHSKSFLISLAILPAVVCMVIIMVNGNLGAGVAVAGTFSLVRFRSAPGSAREISAIFIAMAAGLATGMGYLAYAVLFCVLLSLAMLLYTNSRIGEADDLKRLLKVTIPEDLDYTGAFDDLLSQYTSKWDLSVVRTASMGSLYKLSYDITLKNGAEEKKMIDAMRCRNGNLEIILSKKTTLSEEL